MDPQDADQQQAPDEQSDGDGAVSEVGNLGDGEPIQPDQSIAGAPDQTNEQGEGEVQEGRQGPNAVTGNETQEREDRGPHS